MEVEEVQEVRMLGPGVPGADSDSLDFLDSHL
jgi:hypothetical protein